MILQYLISAFAIERAVELITTSVISDMIFRDRMRAYIYSEEPKSKYVLSVLKFVDKVTSCGYCCSVWIAILFTFFDESRYFRNPLINILALHGLSNIIHIIYEFCRRGRVHTYDINLSCKINMVDEHDSTDSKTQNQYQD